MSNLTKHTTDITQYWYDKLTAKKDDFGVTDVWWGDQKQIPRTPAICVETGPIERRLDGSPMRTANSLFCYVLVYLTKIGDNQETRKEADQLAETIMDYMDTDAQNNAGGLVIEGFVTMLEPGYAQRSGALMRTARLTWEGLSKTRVV